MTTRKSSIIVIPYVIQSQITIHKTVGRVINNSDVDYCKRFYSDRQLVIHIKAEANHRNANLNPLVRTRTVPRTDPRSLSKENAYGETNRRSGMSRIDWVFRLANPTLQKQATRRAGLARGDHYSRARFVNGFYLWHCKLYNQPPQGRRLI